MLVVNVTVGNAVESTDLVLRTVADGISSHGSVLVNRVRRVGGRPVDAVHNARAIACAINIISKSVAEITQDCLFQLAVQIGGKRIRVASAVGYYSNPVHRIVSVVFVGK